MTNEAEREVMGLILTTNAEVVGGVLRGAGGSAGYEVLAAIAATRSLDLIVDDILHALVRQARAEGRTWAEIGDVLHVTRQAAFQRFGTTTGESAVGDVSLLPLAGAESMAVQVLEHYLHERWEDVRADFDGRMRAALSVEMLASAHRTLAARVGPFVALRPPTIAVRDGYTVVDVPLAFAQGDLTGRVAFNVDQQVAGFFLLPPDAA